MSELLGRPFTVFGLLLLSGIAHALEVDSATPAEGARHGPVRGRLSLELEGRYDSLMGYVSSGSGQVPVPGAMLAARPGGQLEWNAEKVFLRLSGAGEVALEVRPERGVRWLGHAGMESTLNRGGVVEVQVQDAVARVDRTENQVLVRGEALLDTPWDERLDEARRVQWLEVPHDLPAGYNDLKVAVPLYLRDRTWRLTPWSALSMDFPEVPPLIIPGCVAPPAQCTVHIVPATLSAVQSGLAARFLPMPWLGLAAEAKTFFRPTMSFTLPSTILAEGQLGANAQLLRAVDLSARAGFAVDVPTQIATPTWELGAAWRSQGGARVSASYVRSLNSMPFGTRAIDDSVKVAGRFGVLGGRFTLLAAATLDLLDRPLERQTDVLAGVSAAPSVLVTPWLEVAGWYSLTLRIDGAVMSWSFLRHEAAVQLRVRYGGG